MRLYRIENPAAFDEAPEVAMDVHFAGRRDTESSYSFIVLGTYQPWLKPSLPLDEREGLFEGWLRGLRILG